MSGIEAAFFGALGGDAEKKTSKTGKPYLRLNVRVGDGEGATWVSVLAFDPRAIEQADKFLKGARCYIKGRLSADEWTAQDGTKRHGLSVLSWYTRLSEIGRNKSVRKNGDAKPRPQEKPASANAFYDDEIPFAPEFR
jgi:single-stranded DNA-binding protein